MRLRLTVLVALVTAFVVIPGAPAGSKAVYYVSLGDSLAQGFQPIGGPPSRESPPGYNQGYTDQLFKLMRGSYQQLREVKLGCGGETTTTLRFGGLCSYAQGSQLAEAVAFLEENPGSVAFVTIDVGANDLLGGGSLLDVATNLPVILGALRNAAGPDVPIVAMNYYPVLIAPVWFQTGSVAAVQAQAATIIAFNDFLEGIYQAFGVPVADVEAAFATTDATIQPSGLPLNVQRICDWTWMCSQNDIHANTAGYRVIAEAFAEVFGSD